MRDPKFDECHFDEQLSQSPCIVCLLSSASAPVPQPARRALIAERGRLRDDFFFRLREGVAIALNGFKFVAKEQIRLFFFFFLSFFPPLLPSPPCCIQHQGWRRRIRSGAINILPPFLTLKRIPPPPPARAADSSDSLFVDHSSRSETFPCSRNVTTNEGFVTLVSYHSSSQRDNAEGPYMIFFQISAKPSYPA